MKTTAKKKTRGDLISEIASWTAAFRSAAESDDGRKLAEHLLKLDIPAAPELLLEGTIEFVSACVALALMDGRPVSEFLRLQQYDSARVPGATYEITFELFDKAFARVVTASDLEGPDLADLYEFPWERHQSVGYSGFWITRTDDADLSAEELSHLEQAVTADLRFDYPEDELDFWFDDESQSGALRVSVQDHYEADR